MLDIADLRLVDGRKVNKTVKLVSNERVWCKDRGVTDEKKLGMQSWGRQGNF